MTTSSRNRTKLRAGIAAAALSAGFALSAAGPAAAAGASPPEDQISMACTAVKDSSDPAAAAALRFYGFDPEDVKGKVGFFCTPTEDPTKANFCAIANQKDAFLAIGTEGACKAGASKAPQSATPTEPAQGTSPTEPVEPTQPATPTEPTQPATPIEPPPPATPGVTFGPWPGRSRHLVLQG